jgi:hypothetical protein
MAFALPTLTRRALAAVFRLGAPVVRSGTYVRPPTFNSTTGQMISAEASAACSFVGAHVQSAFHLGLAPVVPGTERLLIRASELAVITSPARGDYLVENVTGLRRNIEGARLDVSGEFYTFQALASLDEDWGDLAAHSTTDDWGDLTAATTFDDWLTLN